MSLPPFLRFRPVPVKLRHDGWSPERQYRFVLGLARGLRPGEAAERLGMTRQTAYALRRKRGAEQFAAAWDEALAFAWRNRIAPPEDAPAPRRRAPAPPAITPGAPSPQRQAFDAMLDRLYPRGGRQT